MAEPWPRRKAHAKINPFLRVLGRRDDGYHDVETLLLPSICTTPSRSDRPASGSRGRRGRELAVEVTGTAPPSSPRPAARSSRSRPLGCSRSACGGGRRTRGATIRIEKRIPVAAGLGGGSADAAAVLVALNERWGCGFDAAALAELGAGVGSDVPALLAGEPAYCTGRGDVVHPVPRPVLHWVVRPLPFVVRTPDAFGWWDEDGGMTGPDAGALIASLETGNDDLTGHALANDLQAAAIRRHPEVGEAIEAFLDAGALGAVMTGSGPTVIALAATWATQTISRKRSRLFVTSAPPPQDASLGPSGVV